MKLELQERFDGLLQDAIDSLPERFFAVLEEIAVIVEDHPSPELVKQLRATGVIPEAEDPSDPADLMGLHTGVAITEQSAGDSGVLPPVIHVFREGIVEAVGGWDVEHADEEIYEEVRITLLHEIGHHFGLDEDDLDELGYA